MAKKSEPVTAAPAPEKAEAVASVQTEEVLVHSTVGRAHLAHGHSTKPNGFKKLPRSVAEHLIGMFPNELSIVDASAAAPKADAKDAEIARLKAELEALKKGSALD